MKLSIVHKLSLISILLVLISSSVVGLLFYFKTTDLLIKHTLEDISRDINDSGELLQNTINNQRDDVLFLVNTPPIQGIIRTQSGKVFDKPGNSTYHLWKTRLQSIFESQLKRKTSYLSIRFINEQGQELIHLGRKGSEIINFSGKLLQNKSHRNYFRKTLSLATGSVYLSEINLNREFGKVTRPYKEVLRTATPVYSDITGHSAGIVVITSEIGPKLRNIQKRIHDKTHNNIYITNDQGGYLLHPDETKSYGFDLGKRYRIQEELPVLAKLFIPGNKDKQLTLLPKNTNKKTVISFTKIPFDITHPERFISVTMTQDYKSILAEQSAVLNNIIAWTFILSIIAMTLGIIFSIRLIRPIKQMTQLADDFAQNKDMEISLPVVRNDEVGVLARSFASMISQIKKSQKELNDINNNLENIVSERTRLLEDSETHQRLILDTVADAIITIDDNGLIKSFNHAAQKIFGYSENEVLNKNVSLLLPKSKRIEHQAYTDNVTLNAPRIINVTRDLIAQRKNGCVFPIELNVSPINSKLEKGVVAVIRDITERQRIDKMKDEFISTVSHELRTPLTSIRGSLGLISGGTFGEIPEQIDNMLNVANNNTERLLLLINDILDIQKIESGEMLFHYEKIDITELVEQAIGDNKAYGDQYDVTFKITDTVPDAHIKADKHRLMQVMANLLSNAAKFSLQGSQVEISTAISNDNRIRVSVTDHGSGIPENFLIKVFDKFTQSDSSDTRQKGGTGLGLNVSKSIVEKMHGFIGVKSTEGEGSTFWFEFRLVNKK